MECCSAWLGAEPWINQVVEPLKPSRSSINSTKLLGREHGRNGMRVLLFRICQSCSTHVDRVLRHQAPCSYQRCVTNPPPLQALDEHLPFRTMRPPLKPLSRTTRQGGLKTSEPHVASKKWCHHARMNTLQCNVWHRSVA